MSKRETHILLIGDQAEHERLQQLLAQPRGEMRFRLERQAEGAALAAMPTPSSSTVRRSPLYSSSAMVSWSDRPVSAARP